MLNDSTTLKNLTAPTSPEKLTLFPVDSLASRFPLPGSERAKQTTVRSGVKCCELYVQFSPLGLLAKTLLESSAWNSTRCLLTWKASATPAKRLLFRLVPSTPCTEETEFGLLPTPKAQSKNSPGFYGTGGQDIQTTVAVMAGLLPTPTQKITGKTSDNFRPALHEVVRQLIPTPTAQDAKNLTCPPSQKDRDSIPGFLLSAQSNGSHSIHPIFYERLMGYPDGWTDVEPE